MPNIQCKLFFFQKRDREHQPWEALVTRPVEQAASTHGRAEWQVHKHTYTHTHTHTHKHTHTHTHTHKHTQTHTYCVLFKKQQVHIEELAADVRLCIWPKDLKSHRPFWSALYSPVLQDSFSIWEPLVIFMVRVSCLLAPASISWFQFNFTRFKRITILVYVRFRFICTTDMEFTNLIPRLDYTGITQNIDRNQIKCYATESVTFLWIRD